MKSANTASNTALNGKITNLADDVAKHFGGGSQVDKDGRVTAPTYTIVNAATGESVDHHNVGSAISALVDNAKTAAEDTAKYLGGGATVGEDGRVTAPTYSITDVTGTTPTAKDHNNVGSALAVLDGNTKTLDTKVKALEGASNGNAKAITDLTTTVAKGLNFAGDKGTTNRKLGSTLKVKGDKNITTKASDGEVMISLSDNPIFTGTVISGGLTILNNSKVDMGNNVVTNVKNGKVTKDSKDAATAGQVYNTASDTANHLGGGSTIGADGHITAPTYSITDVQTGQTGVYNSVGSALQTLDNNTKAITAQIGKMGGDIQSLHGEVQTLRKDAFAGTASAMAIAGLGQSTQAGKTSVSMSGSAYRGQNAYALGISRMSSNGKFLLKGAVSGNNRGHYGGVVSATYTFD